jgi:hypothetical protein
MDVVRHGGGASPNANTSCSRSKFIASASSAISRQRARFCRRRSEPWRTGWGGMLLELDNSAVLMQTNWIYLPVALLIVVLLLLEAITMEA